MAIESGGGSAPKSVDPRQQTLKPMPARGATAGTVPGPASSLKPAPPPVSGYSREQLKQFWTMAGGNPAKANEAAAIALATSGTGKVRTRKAGPAMWGATTRPDLQPSADPITNARTAVGTSQNGTSWRGFPAAYGTDGSYMSATAPAARYMTDQPTANPGFQRDPTLPDDRRPGWDLLDVFTPDTYIRVAGYAVEMFLGSFLMIVGFALIVVTNKKVRTTAKGAFSTVFSGFGFGLGASAGSKVTGESVAGSAVAASPDAVMPRSVPRAITAPRGGVSGGGDVHGWGDISGPGGLPKGIRVLRVNANAPRSNDGRHATSVTAADSPYIGRRRIKWED